MRGYCPTHGEYLYSGCGLFSRPCGQCAAEDAAADARAEWEAMSPEARAEILAWVERDEAERKAKAAMSMLLLF